MERRVHPTFARRLFTSALGFFAAAMSCLVVGMVGESEQLPAAKAAGMCGFVICGAGIPVSAWWRSRGCRCPGCRRWLAADPARDREETLRFPCPACGVEWDTQGVIDLW